MSYVFPRAGVGALAAFGALGAFDFNASTVWSDWQAGAAGDNAAGARAAKAIQAALNSLGYGPIAVDGQFGKGSIAAWNSFASQNSVTKDWPDQTGIIKLGEVLQAGGTPGGSQPISYNIVSGQYVPETAGAGVAKAGMSTGTMLGLGVAVLAGIGLLALAAKKKRGGVAPSASTPHKAESAMKAA